MTTQDALIRLRILLMNLRGYTISTDEDSTEELIQALEEFAIPMLEERAQLEELTVKFVEAGLPGPILTPDELKRILGDEKTHNVLDCRGLSI